MQQSPRQGYLCRSCWLLLVGHCSVTQAKCFSMENREQEWDGLPWCGKTVLLLALTLGTGLFRVNMPNNQNHSHLLSLQLLELFFILRTFKSSSLSCYVWAAWWFLLRLPPWPLDRAQFLFFHSAGRPLWRRCRYVSHSLCVGLQLTASLQSSCCSQASL